MPDRASVPTAQVKVFAQCSGEAGFVPPEDPAPDWLPLERYGREYQIAAAYFYAGQYLEAATRFGDIGRNVDSPWRDLGRYPVGRSLAREAIVNDNDPPRHLGLALTVYGELAEDPAYLAAGGRGTQRPFERSCTLARQGELSISRIVRRDRLGRRRRRWCPRGRDGKRRRSRAYKCRGGHRGTSLSPVGSLTSVSPSADPAAG